MPRDYFQQQSDILCSRAQWAYLVKTTRKGHEPVSANSSIGRLETYRATKGGWLANRPTSIATH